MHLSDRRLAGAMILLLLLRKKILKVFRACEGDRVHIVNRQTLNTYRTAVSPTLDLLCHEDFNVGRSEAESNIEIFMAQ